MTPVTVSDPEGLTPELPSYPHQAFGFGTNFSATPLLQ